MLPPPAGPAGVRPDAVESEAQHSQSWTAPVQPDVNGDLLISTDRA